MEQSKTYDVLDYRNLDKLISLLDKAIAFANKDDEVDLNMPTSFDLDHGCGTVFCIGGWVFVSTTYIKNNEIVRPSGPVSFRGGVDMINDILKLDLEVWAKNNPDLWGEGDGTNALYDEMAYVSGNRPNGAKSILDVRDHFKELSAKLQNI